MKKGEICGIINEMIDDLNLFDVGQNEIKSNVQYDLIQLSSYCRLFFNANLKMDCLDVYSKHKKLDIDNIQSIIRNDISIFKKYGVIEHNPSFSCNLIRDNFEIWKKTELKKLKDFTKKNFNSYIHSLRCEFDSRLNVYPKIKIIFRGGINNWEYHTTLKVLSEIKNYSTKVLDFSDNIRIVK